MDIEEKSLQIFKTTAPFLREDGVEERPWLDVSLPWYAKVFLWLLSFAQLPSSLALVPDGHRRWAKQRGAPLHLGHIKGSSLLEQVQAAVLALGVRESFVFTFSVRNFGRPEEQRVDLFNHMNRSFDSICNNWEFYQKKEWSFRTRGDIERFPKELHKRAAKMELLTHQTSAKSNIYSCGPYESRHQITRMAVTLCHAVRDGLLEPSDITPYLIDAYNEIEDCPHVECYLRTSGERRLSDFMTWQTDRAAIYFEKKNYPDIGYWDMFKIMLHYSASWSSRKRLDDCYIEARSRTEQRCSAAQRLKERKFQSWLEARRQAYLRRLVGDDL
ncbi:dehydrodolichyl diphosphate synthase complex subunit SPAC4D7.04c [Ixodes scapularis]